MEKLYGKYFVAAAVFSVVVPFTSAANLGEACSVAGDCTTINAVCETNCVCKGSFKANADNTTCIKRGLNDTCIASTDSDCVGVQHAVCKPTDNVCACIGAYKPNGAACIAKGLNDTCAASRDSECVGVPNAVCKPTDNVCACLGAYKQTGVACVAKAVDDSCTQSTDCSTGDANSECSTDTPRKCVCKTDFTAINNVCKKGLGNTCTNDTSCSAVSNAECPATKKCTCKANYKEANGLCSIANGLRTLLSAPLAFLLSILTIVLTRLH